DPVTADLLSSSALAVYFRFANGPSWSDTEAATRGIISSRLREPLTSSEEYRRVRTLTERLEKAGKALQEAQARLQQCEHERAVLLRDLPEDLDQQLPRTDTEAATARQRVDG